MPGIKTVNGRILIGGAEAAVITLLWYWGEEWEGRGLRSSECKTKRRLVMLS